MSELFCKALSEMLEQQMGKIEDNDLQQLKQEITPVRGLSNRVRITTFDDLLFNTAQHVIRRRCKIFTRELNELCLAVNSGTFPVIIFFSKYGWKLFPTLKSMLTFLDDLIQTEARERKLKGISLYQESLLRQNRGEKSYTPPKERTFSSHESIIL